MSTNPFIKFGIVTGEVAEGYIFRNDLDRIDLGVKLAQNFFVNYRGGATVRAGFEFLDYLGDDDKEIVLHPFVFSADGYNTYMLVVGHNYIRFLQEGAYVLEESKTFTVTGTNFFSPSHGYVGGDMIKIAGETYFVSSAPGGTTNAFALLTAFGEQIDANDFTTDQCARVYTVTSPYVSDDLNDINFEQDGNEFIISSLNYKERRLIRNDHTDWELVLWETTQSVLPAITLNAINSSGTGTYGIVAAVTTVDSEGKESFISSDALLAKVNVRDISTVAGEYKFEASTVPGAVAYKFYRSRIVPEDDVHYGMALGFIGQSLAPVFTDVNIIPDFNLPPPSFFNPFTGGKIFEMEITSPGTGYTLTKPAITLANTGGGTDFDAIGVVIGDEIAGVLIFNEGENYGPATTATITGSATITPKVSALEGNNPGHAKRSQQRVHYVGTRNNPSRIFSPAVGSSRNFQGLGNGEATDPFILDLDRKEASEILNVATNPDGFFVFTATEIFQIRATDDRTLSEDTAKNLPQNSGGATHLPPLLIDREIVFMSQGGDEVRSLRPSNLPTYYTVEPLSILSHHLFQTDNEIVSWAWAKTPYRLLYAVRADGTLVQGTISTMQNIYAWTSGYTQGLFKQIASLMDGGQDKFIAVIEREINGKTKKYLERQGTAEPSTVEYMSAMDSYLATTQIYPESSIRISAREMGEEITITSATPVFSEPDVGKELRAFKGKAVVTEYISTTEIRAYVQAEFKFGQINYLPRIPEGKWTLDPTFTIIGGLQHLEGMKVDVNANGRLFQDTVLGGEISLTTPASLVHVGLPFDGLILSLPPTLTQDVIEHKLKNTNEIWLRLKDATRFLYGQDEFTTPIENLYDGFVSDFTNGIVPMEINEDFSYDAPISIIKRGPSSGTILGYILEVDIGPD